MKVTLKSPEVCFFRASPSVHVFLQTHTFTPSPSDYTPTHLPIHPHQIHMLRIKNMLLNSQSLLLPLLRMRFNIPPIDSPIPLTIDITPIRLHIQPIRVLHPISHTPY